jgi:hypothetical protein
MCKKDLFFYRTIILLLSLSFPLFLCSPVNATSPASAMTMSACVNNINSYNDSFTCDNGFWPYTYQAGTGYHILPGNDNAYGLTNTVMELGIENAVESESSDATTSENAIVHTGAGYYEFRARVNYENMTGSWGMGP